MTKLKQRLKPKDQEIEEVKENIVNKAPKPEAQP